MFKQENALTSLPEDLASWQSLRLLRLEGNPFHCSCDLLWLRDLLSLSKFKNSSFLVLCDEPREVHEKRISSLSEKDLDCYLNGPMQKILLGVSIGVVVIFLAIFFFLLYRFHDKIKNAWKRNCFRRGRNGGPRKSQRGNTPSTVKASELDSSTKTSFLSQSAYPYSDEEYALRTSLMSPTPHTSEGNHQGPYATHSLNPNSLSLHRQIQHHNYPIHSLSHPHYHYQNRELPYVHGHPNGTLPVPRYADAEYETPVLGIGGFYPSQQHSHHYTDPANGMNGHSGHNPNVHYNSHQQIVKPVPVTEL